MADAFSLIHIIKAKESDIPTINFIAHEVWPVTYRDVIPQEQIVYMLDWMYSPESLRKQMLDEGCTFFILLENNQPKGFASYSNLSHRIFKLHKLYVSTTSQRSGCGRKLLDTVINEVSLEGGGELQLQVNKKNPSCGFYKKLGFVVLEEAVFDIGNGFVMDDFIMTKKV